MHHSRVIINKNKLVKNIKNIKQFSNKKLSAVIKANAYGHGIREVVNIIKDYVNYFQVDDYKEFIEINNYTNKNTLISGYLTSEELAKVILKGGIPCINSLNQLNNVRNLTSLIKKKTKIHLKIDCLIGRQGLLPNQLAKASRIINESKYIRLEGVFTHFSDVDNNNHVKRQINCYKNCTNILEQNSIKGFLKHINSTSGMFLDKYGLETDIDRVGIGMYGLWHSKNMKKMYSNKLSLEPILSWKSKIAQVKHLPKGHPVGYKLTHKTKRRTKVGVIPIGYSDGFDRRLSNKGMVLIKNKLCPVIGLVSMNMFVVDVNHVSNVREGDDVILIGNSNNVSISADDIAEKLNTINYEVLSRISTKIPRIVV